MSNNKHFPPLLEVGSRVWTSNGYLNHGPIDGPKVDISGHMGGTIIYVEKLFITMDSLLYCIKWDNGQTSKHYSTSLFCIGRFQSVDDFKAAISIINAIELTIGPQGGFRYAKIRLKYDGEEQDCEIYDRLLWIEILEPLAKAGGVEILIVQLPPKRKQKKE